MAARRYVELGWIDRLFNGAVAALARAGVSVYGSRILAVRVRRSGAWRSVPVNLLEHAGKCYLVAPRGETQWVRNLRASGTGELRLGSRREPFRATELADAQKPPVLRAYLERWRFEVKRFFAGIGSEASDADLARIAPHHPVFLIERD
jgi:deazaflavin-dependent oxidoreductase (nitroreductase family)